MSSIQPINLSFFEKVSFVTGWDHFTRARNTESLFKQYERQPANNLTELRDRILLLKNTFNDSAGETYLEQRHPIIRQIHRIASWILSFFSPIPTQKNFDVRILSLRHPFGQVTFAFMYS